VAVHPDFCVSIHMEGTTDYVGSGVLLDPMWVLTAWHVTWAFQTKKPIITAGTQTTFGIVPRSPAFARPPATGGWRGPDLALIKLQTPLHIAPVHWATAAEFDSACGGTFVGFGPSPGSDRVRPCGFDLARCSSGAGRYTHDPAINFVGVQMPGSLFHGDDSGGPMLIQTSDNTLKLAGIVSRAMRNHIHPHGPLSYLLKRGPRIYLAARVLFWLARPSAKAIFTRTDGFKTWAEGATGVTFP
jgi:hypothetical protein